MMDRFDEIAYVIDQALSTKKKRHVTGGILMSIALLFGGLAFTVVTLKTEDKL